MAQGHIFLSQNPPPNPIGTQSNTIDLDGGEDSAPSSFTSKRPLGRDSSKEKAKKQRSENTSSTDSEYLTRMGDLSLERLSVYKSVGVSTPGGSLDQRVNCRRETEHEGGKEGR
jgi:hypothetical protein